MHFAGRDVAEIPFLHRTTWVFGIDMALMVLVSLTDPASVQNPKGIAIDTRMFRVSRSFVAGSVVIFSILAVLYTLFW
jgi:solute:Na+ symporter, SSS family